MKNKLMDRRRVLRGLFQGASMGVGLPLLDVFLNDNGNAFASGERLPVCFGTWFWALGLAHLGWAPKQAGRDHELPEHLKAFAPIKDKVNIYSGTQVFAEGVASVHVSGPQGQMTGAVTGRGGTYFKSIDALVAEKLNIRTRFQSIDVSCTGMRENCFSARRNNVISPAEISPLALYKRVFGTGFHDPNSAEFTPDLSTVLRKGALSVVKNERQDLVKLVGASDKIRLDEYFTSLRDLEQRLALELEKPQPLEACTVPGTPKGEHPGLPIADVMKSHKLFVDLIVHALACGQTRIFNLAFNTETLRPGDPSSHHVYSHEENINPELGYQPMTMWFAVRFMEAFRDMVLALDGLKEGDHTLLDRTLVMAYTDHGDARLHRLEHMPIFTAGGAGGGMKTGLHVAASGGDPSSRVGLTCQQALGVPVTRWGAGANMVSEPFAEVLA